MDELLPVPSAEVATALTQERIRFEVGVRLQKMAMEAQASQAAELLKLMGVGENLDLGA